MANEQEITPQQAAARSIAAILKDNGITPDNADQIIDLLKETTKEVLQKLIVGEDGGLPISLYTALSDEFKKEGVPLEKMAEIAVEMGKTGRRSQHPNPRGSNNNRHIIGR